MAEFSWTKARQIRRGSRSKSTQTPRQTRYLRSKSRCGQYHLTFLPGRQGSKLVLRSNRDLTLTNYKPSTNINMPRGIPNTLPWPRCSITFLRSFPEYHRYITKTRTIYETACRTQEPFRTQWHIKRALIDCKSTKPYNPGKTRTSRPGWMIGYELKID